MNSIAAIVTVTIVTGAQLSFCATLLFRICSLLRQFFFLCARECLTNKVRAEITRIPAPRMSDFSDLHFSHSIFALIIIDDDREWQHVVFPRSRYRCTCRQPQTAYMRRRAYAFRVHALGGNDGGWTIRRYFPRVVNCRLAFAARRFSAFSVEERKRKRARKSNSPRISKMSK